MPIKVNSEHLQKRKRRRTVRLEQHRTDPFEDSRLERDMLASSFGITEGKIEWTLPRVTLSRDPLTKRT